MKKLVFALAIAVAGCAATGVQVTDEQMSEFTPGETIKAEVVEKLGQPTSQTRLSDGTTVLTYTYAEYRTRPETFIPYVGMFVGGGDTRSNHVTLTFDSNDVLADYSSSSSELGTATGVAPTSTPIEPVADQPRKPI